ncbi:phosphoribosylformylglycinamidine synthase subunit PurS [Bacillus thuringiensis]
MYKVKVYVTLRESVLDPQGTAVKGALHSLSFMKRRTKNAKAFHDKCENT